MYFNNKKLRYDTEALRSAANRYNEIADELSVLASELDICLKDLSESGWTTKAGKAFEEMANTGWKKNMEKYTDLLKQLNEILCEAANEYDSLTAYCIEKTKIVL